MSPGGGLDPELLAGFHAEVQGYVPLIRRGLDEFSRLGNPRSLIEPHRLVHTVKGAASMLGLEELAESARQGEEALERLLEAGDAESSGAILAEVWSLTVQLAADGAPAAPPGPPAAQVRAALSELPEEAVAEILSGFRQEAAEHVAAATRLLRELAQAPGDLSPLGELRRVLHTFKGAAAVVGCAPLADLCHHLEDLVPAVLAGPVPVPEGALDALFAGLEEIEGMVLDEQPTAGAAAAEHEMPPLRTVRTMPPTAGGGPAPSGIARWDAGEPAPARPGAVRDDLRRLQEVLRLSGELVVNHTSFEERLQGLRRHLNELDLAVARLRRVARQIEVATEPAVVAGLAGAAAARDRAGSSGPPAVAFDALELERYTGLDLLSRSLAENAADLSSLARDLAGDLGGAESDRRELKRLTRGLQAQMLRFQLAPLGTLAARLDRTVRATAAQEGKQVDFALAGEEVELDRTILAGIADPLLHLLRNAVGHGIEPPARRREAGKPESGRVEVRARLEGSQVAIEVADDGAGIDWGAIEAAAAAAGVASGPHLLFESGFTTAAVAGAVSGRGVGLDVVKTEVERLRGSVVVSSRAGGGATFTLRLPQSLALARVVLVRAAGETMGVPAANVVEVVRLAEAGSAATPDSREVVAAGEGAEHLRDAAQGQVVAATSGESFPVRDLAELLALPAAERSGESRSALLIAAGGRRLALAVEDLAGIFDAVVGGLGTLLPRVRGVSGVAVAGDGRLVLVLNPSELLGLASSREGAARRRPQGRQRIGPAALRRSVLVVDDSLSVRRVLTNLLQGAGWEVQAARDGREALELLQAATPERLPQVAVVDLEMPRMNGFELLASLRGEPSLCDLPVVFLTSRAGGSHRETALSLGAAAYLVKPYQDAHLLATLAGIARPEASHAGA